MILVTGKRKKKYENITPSYSVGKHENIITAKIWLRDDSDSMITIGCDEINEMIEKLMWMKNKIYEYKGSD